MGYEPKAHLGVEGFWPFFQVFRAVAMSEEASLEKTPESGGVRALEDIPASAGALVQPAGPPTVLGPANWNPFWSEGWKDEAILRAIRPLDLPSDSTELLPGETPNTSPPRERQEAVKAFVQSLISENARLWSEREAWSQSSGSWGHQPPWSRMVVSGTKLRGVRCGGP